MSFEGTKSQFNDAVTQIGRLDRIWGECRSYRERGFLIKWKFRLDSAAIELSYDITKCDTEKNKDYRGQVDKLDTQILETERGIIISKYKADGFKALYELLVRKEILLREVQEVAGKGGKYVDEDEDAF